MTPPSPALGPANFPLPASGSLKTQERQKPLDRRDCAAVVVLVLAVAALFWKVLFTSQMFFYRDVYNYTFPHAKFIHDACRHGFLPYWNPLLNYGEPVLADPNFLFFYPYTLFIVLLPVAYAYCLHYVLHFAIAAIGVYLLARQWRQSRWAALFAAAAFGFSGPLLSLGDFYNNAAGAAWIPWALLLTDKAINRRSARPWILLTVIFSLQFLAGEMFTLLATFVLALAYALHRVLRCGSPWAASPRKILGGFMAVGLLMIALCAVQLLPASHLLINSRRGVHGLPYDETTYWSFHPLRLLEFVLPNFFGSPPETPTLWTSVLGGRNDPYLPSVFVGFVTLFFAFLGWAVGHDRRRNFSAGAALALLLLAFGRFTPLFALGYLLFPPLELVRFPVKLLVPCVLLVALLAGWGLDAIRDPSTDWCRRRRTILLPLKFLLGGTILLWMAAFFAPGWLGMAAAKILIHSNRPYLHTAKDELTSAQIIQGAEFLLTMLKVYLPGLAGLLLGAAAWLVMLERKKPKARQALPVIALLGIGQLALVHYSVNPTVPKLFYTYQPPVLEKLAISAMPYRLFHVYRNKRSKTLTRDRPDPQVFLNFESIPAISRLSALAQNDFRARLVLSRGAMLTGAEAVLNNDVDLSMPIPMFHFWVFLQSQMPDAARADCLMGRTNIKYEIFDSPQKSSTLQEVSTIFNGSADPSFLYENRCVTPRAYVADTTFYASSPLETLTRLSAPDFDVYQQVILPASTDATSTRSSLRSAGPAGAVKILNDQANAVTLQAAMKRAGYVVLLDRYDPDWHASMDHRTVAILRANLLFRTVRVPPGTHMIRFYYRQKGLAEGALISLATLVLLIMGYCWDPLPR